jgi:hypothetical protein
MATKGLRWGLSLLALLAMAVGVSANTCVEIPSPKKPLSHVCGVIVDRTGATVAGAKVQILTEKDDSVLAEVQSDSNGRFSFETLKEGRYQIRVVAQGFSGFQVPIRVHNPKEKCKGALKVTVVVGGPCGSSAELERN